MRIIAFVTFKVPYFRELPQRRLSKNKGLLGLPGGEGGGGVGYRTAFKKQGAPIRMPSPKTYRSPNPDPQRDLKIRSPGTIWEII